ncbi:D-serine/D-alanine/glycine transporter [Dehalobacter sp. DCA]|jgi:Gamma-aminobutyrate permease and related permeases|uniref:amino acid permease n=1 Tax=Dehalobacter sp. DCA TaxID=1147129 RepID=UPI00028B9F75|nr:amino acid permease [Dehalobacter sp. DCA]AFV02148.1 D-serine/D-alanine/glycine transporter [Dehalobacter sp. DCA]
MENKHQGLSAWQLTMMALGTVIGGSFFLGSSVAINAAGPSIILSFILGGVIVYFILFALSEMTVANPDIGSFRTFAAQAFGRGTGFVVGWVYWAGMVLAMSSEATAVSILMREWVPNISIAWLGSFIIIGITLLNLLGADKLSKLESGLAAVKLLALASFILIALLLILGLFPAVSSIGIGELVREPLMPTGIKGIAGSMLIVIFSYAGFEIIGLAASEANNPIKTIPKAISHTVLILLAFYIISIAVLLPLIPTSSLSEKFSPMVAALDRWGIGWAGSVINFVLITAILSTMLAAMFGLGRMMRSLAEEGQAPRWLKDRGNVPHRGILISGLAMLAGLGIGLLLPSVYLFLISSGGFALLFTYAVIMATHLRFRKKYGCPPSGKCQMPGYPYSTWIVFLSLILIIISMPFISGQGTGLIAGIIMIALFSVIYMFLTRVHILQTDRSQNKRLTGDLYKTKLTAEFSEALIDKNNCQKKEKPDKG